MASQKLLLGMIVLLIAAAAGVFVLVRQDTPAEIAKDSLVAGVGVQEDQIAEEQSTVENKEQEKQDAQTSESSNQAQKVAKQTTPIPSPAPVLVEEPETEELEPPVPESVPEPPLPPSVSSPQPIGKININTAGLEDLDLISEVGPAIAQRIIDYRTNVSLFYVIEDIKNVSGIGDATFEKMKNDITVGDVGPAPQPSPPPPAPTSSPAPTPAPTPQPQGQVFYTSSYHTAKYYYCDTDSAWEGLSEKYLESYSSEQAVLAVYPEKTLHEPCE